MISLYRCQVLNHAALTELAEGGDVNEGLVERVH
jgi:hypothetical protein